VVNHYWHPIPPSIIEGNWGLTAVRENGLAIQYIKNPSEKVQLALVRQVRDAIEYLKKYHLSEKIRIAAVQQNPSAIKYVKKQNTESKNDGCSLSIKRLTLPVHISMFKS
jgi:hypothetical protein